MQPISLVQGSGKLNKRIDLQTDVKRSGVVVYKLRPSPQRSNDRGSVETGVGYAMISSSRNTVCIDIFGMRIGKEQ